MAQFFAGSLAELNTAIASANASGDAVNTITLTSSFALTGAPTILNPQGGTALVIDGDGFTIDGQNAHRIFFANSGDITIQNVTLANGLAEGGDGGDGSSAGGGGMGAGGALFVNSGADVTITNVAFAENGATGGDGGRGALVTGGGGGGGMGGDGGDAPHLFFDPGNDDAITFGIFGGG
ncbi:pectate lyase-like adhesive domain-containing protein, partial [Bauldia litoralis]|uniref:pectate lyase-like adhesive domain-containing protein n=1 Tax=Bauldia litoralis TaxID=665467 RepID=UPI0032657279